MRALGELVLHRPTAGSFVYVRAGVHRPVGRLRERLDVLAQLGDDRRRRDDRRGAIYTHRWLPGVPQWIVALAALVVLLTVNLLSVGSSASWSSGSR